MKQPLNRRFLTVWLGQTISEVGTMLSGVGAAIYVFITTGSAAWLGVLSALAAVPYVLTAPLGALVDRWPRRRVMIWADIGAAIGPLFALTMALSGQLAVWHLAVAGFVGGVGNSLQMPASQAAVPALAGVDAIDRAHSLKQLGPAIGIVVGPVVAAPIVAWWGIEAILLVDLATFGIGVAAVLIVPFDDHRDEQPVPDDGTWATMWAWLSSDGRPLLKLMAVTAVVNFVLAFFSLAIIALATDVGGVARSGTVLGVGGLAMLAGSLVVAQRGLADDRVGTFATVLIVMSAGILVTALRPSLVWVTIGVVIALGAVPAVNAAMSTIYSEHTPASMQGRVFALRGAIGQSLQPIGSLVAGVVIARVAGPAIDTDGPLAGSVGAVIGTGVERGSALLLLGCVPVLVVMATWLRGSGLRRALHAFRVSSPAREPDATTELSSALTGK